MSRHLSKLFDSLCKLKFQLGADGKPLKCGLGMYSKEDEYMDFDSECDLSGQVSEGAGHTQAGWAGPPPQDDRAVGVGATHPQTGAALHVHEGPSVLFPLP